MAEAMPLEFSAEEIEDGKVFAGIGYLGILFLLPLLAKPENKFCRAHAKQGMVIFIAWVVCGIIPFVGWFIGWPILFVLAIIGLIKAFQGQFWKVPWLGDIAAKLNF
jgi:uncharacterized membrane protein